MLAAEVVAHLTKKTLDFKDWDGEEEDKVWSREVRRLLQSRDFDVDVYTEPSPPKQDMEHPKPEDGIRVPKPVLPTEGYDSDDSMTGYLSPPSSRSTSPTPSELEELEKDPTLGVGVKKIGKPVYLAQLGQMVRLWE